MERREFIKDLALLAVPLIVPGQVVENIAKETNYLDELVDKLSTEPQLLNLSITSEQIKACFNDPRFKISDKVVKEFEKAAKRRTGAGRYTYEGYYTKSGEYIKGWRDEHDVPGKIAAGPKFYAENKEALEAAEKKYGVDSRYIAAIIGIETNYGPFTGDFISFISLATAYVKTPARKTEKKQQEMREWAYKELVELFKFALKNKKSVYDYNGSYAGAIGRGQYMPSSLNAYFIGQKGTFEADPFDMVDTIYSVAYYLQKNGWDNSQVDPPPEKDSKNWNSIFSYNHDDYYVAGVTEVATKTPWLSKIKTKVGV